MKKLFVIVVAMLSFASCSESVESLSRQAVYDYLETYEWQKENGEDCNPIQFMYGFDYDGDPMVQVKFEKKVPEFKSKRVLFLLDPSFSEASYPVSMNDLYDVLDYTKEALYSIDDTIEYREAEATYLDIINYVNHIIEYRFKKDYKTATFSN